MARGVRCVPAALWSVAAALSCAPGCAALSAAVVPEAGAPSGALAMHAATKTVSALVFDPSECKVCAFNGPAAPRLFIDGRDDGLGNNVEAIIYGMAFARKTGMSFGGVVGGGKMAHGLQVAKIVADIFGLNKDHLYLRSMPMSSQVVQVKHLTDIEKLRLDKNTNDVWLQTNMPQSGVKAPRTIDEFLDDEFLEALRAQMLPRLTEQNPIAAIRHGNGPMVAMHVRRGDVSQWRNPDRYTKNEFYYDLAARIRAQLPGAEVHVWSETAGSSVPEDFDGFRARNITVHLDTDIVETWSHMAQSQVLVMAKSSFSFISAILNRGCVVYQPWLTRPIRSFTATTLHDRTMPTIAEEKLSACLAKAGPSTA
mmetsp:Transcript_99855/g.278933  ORF Transcript_99855/g.278933 Transcript_99855/m.278933 type:complete len:368 (+) Transcript_99855:95-1198(+)